jgi:hypothetical protein
MHSQPVIKSAQYWIAKLGLIAHPEGGYYRETYRAGLSIPMEGLPPEFTGARRVSTAIYFLLEGEGFSAFHRLRSDETLAFLRGRIAHRTRHRREWSLLANIDWERSGSQPAHAGCGQSGQLVCVACARSRIVCAGGMYWGARFRFRGLRASETIRTDQPLSATPKAD